MEMEFLAGLCRPEKGALSIPSQGIDWTRVSDIAFEEGLGGFVYIILKEEKGVPTEVLEEFKSRYYANAVNNDAMFDSLKAVLECLKSSGITTVVFRGASLMGDVYPSLGMRSFHDVDLLLREDDFLKAVDLLKEEGFFSYAPYLSTFSNEHIYIDLHTDLMTHSRVKAVRLSVNTDLDSLFERAFEKEVQGVRFLVLHPEDALLSLTVHHQMHSFDKLIRFLDIARLINIHKKDIDWDRILQRAKRMNLERTLYYNLFLLPNEWKVFEPSTLELFKPRSFHYGEEGLLKKLKQGQIVSYAGDILFMLNARGLWKKTRFLIGVLFPKEEVGFKIILNPIGLIRFLLYRLTKVGKFCYEIARRRVGLTHG